MFRKRIAYRLTAGFVLIALISMLTVGVLFIQMFRQYALESREKLMLNRAHSIAGMMAETGGTGGPMRGMGGFVRFLNTMTDSDVWILDSKGSPWILSGMGMGSGGSQTQSTSTEPLPEEANDVIDQVLAGKDSVSESFSSVYNEATLTVGAPIIDGNKQVVGMVLLHAPVTGVTETMNQAMTILLISLGAALAVAAGLGIAYSLSFTKPLKRMNQVALAMAEGNYDARIKLERPDELGQLGNSLDLLASELAKAMDLLYQEKRKLEDIIGSISEGIVAFNSEGYPISGNANLGRHMGIGNPYPMEAVNSDFEALGLMEDVKQVMQDRSPRKLMRSVKGKHLQFALSPMTDSRGGITGVAGLVQDVSESEKLEQLRRDFVANVSHEFRTPLTVIKGSLEALADGTVSEPEAVSRYIQRLLAETQGLERLVGDLLDLSRLQSESISMEPESIFLPEVLQDAVNGIQTLAEKKSIRIILETGGAVPPVQGDYDRLRQLFIIFIDNAIKYSPPDTVINLMVEGGETVTVSIRDQGQGIAPEDLPYIWDRFYQGDTSRESRGTGLGLAIAKRLIELHQGTVEVISKKGEGTTFRIGFPRG